MLADVFGMSDGTFNIALTAIGVFAGGASSEVRNWLQRRAEAKRQLRTDAITELGGVIDTLKKEMDDRDHRHQADMTEMRGAHSNCQDDFMDLKAKYERLTTDHDALRKDHDAVKQELDEIKARFANAASVAATITGGK